MLLAPRAKQSGLVLGSTCPHAIRWPLRVVEASARPCSFWERDHGTEEGRGPLSGMDRLLAPKDMALAPPRDPVSPLFTLQLKCAKRPYNVLGGGRQTELLWGCIFLPSNWGAVEGSELALRRREGGGVPDRCEQLQDQFQLLGKAPRDRSQQIHFEERKSASLFIYYSCPVLLGRFRGVRKRRLG